jgi:hypothetical protein
VKPLPVLVLAVYLLTLAFFAFRTFKPIPGRTYPECASSTNGIVQAGSALEDVPGSRLLLETLPQTGQMSLEVLLKTDSLEQGGPARIISFSNNPMSRNFTLGQEGNGLSFRLRTTQTDDNGMYPSLTAPGVFKKDCVQHLVVTYDGEKVQLYVDGILRPETIELKGGFSNWGRNQLLTVGDEAAGIRPWAGQIVSFSIYDRALRSSEIRMCHEGGDRPDAVYAFPVPNTMEPLHYRNLVVVSDIGFQMDDCIANIAGFIPLAPLLWLALPDRWRNRYAVWLLPLMVGFSLSSMFELFQRGILGRVPCLVDLAYNVLGSLVGCILLWLGLKHRRFSAMMHAR